MISPARYCADRANGVRQNAIAGDEIDGQRLFFPNTTVPGV
jgi:hypothetical protein